MARNWATGGTQSGSFSDGCSNDCSISFTGTITFLRAAPLITEVKTSWGTSRSNGGGTGYTSLLVDGSWTQVWSQDNPNGVKTANGSWENVTALKVSASGSCAPGGNITMYSTASAAEANGANSAGSQGIQIL